MAVTHPDAVANLIADAVVDSIDVGGAGTLEFQTSGGVEVATLGLSNPAFGSASSRTAQINAVTSDTNATGGVVAKAVLKSGTPADIILFSVTATGGGGDVTMTSINISAGDTVSVAVGAIDYIAPS